MATLRPEDLNLSRLPRNRLGQLKEAGVSELLQRAAWDFREVLAERDRLTRTVEELRQRLDELTQQAASLEAAAERRKDPDELGRVLLAAAQRTAREEREAARHECELMLNKAARRAKQIDEDAAARASEIARIEALREEIIAGAKAQAATITAEAESYASVVLEQAAAASEDWKQEASAAREELEQELAIARRTFTEELASAQADADVALADVQRELERLETETEILHSLRSEAERRVAEIAQTTLEGLESLGATGGAEGDLLGDLQLRP